MLKRDYEGYERAHEVVRLINGDYACNLCHLVWKRSPRTFCAGVPVYRYGCWPKGLYTYTQLRRDLKMKPLDREHPDGAYFLRKSPYRRWLYDAQQAVPHRQLTPRQVEAVAKMRAGLIAHYTCQRCGWHDVSQGKSKHVMSIRDGWCASCWNAFHRLERQVEQCQWARSYVDASPFVVLDSETTGLGREDEVIELAIVSGRSGAVLFNSLIQPEHLAERQCLATHIHGITREDLQAAPRFPEVWPVIRAILRRYHRVIVYNAEFDYFQLKYSAARYGFRLPGTPQGRDWECLMHQFARYNGYWSDYHHGWGWCTLGSAAATLDVPKQGTDHRALADTFTARGVLLAMAAKHGTIDVLAPPEKKTQPSIEMGDLFDDHPF